MTQVLRDHPAWHPQSPKGARASWNGVGGVLRGLGREALGTGCFLSRVTGCFLQSIGQVTLSRRPVRVLRLGLSGLQRHSGQHGRRGRVGGIQKACPGTLGV